MTVTHPRCLPCLHYRPGALHTPWNYAGPPCLSFHPHTSPPEVAPWRRPDRQCPGRCLLSCLRRSATSLPSGATRTAGQGRCPRRALADVGVRAALFHLSSLSMCRCRGTESKLSLRLASTAWKRFHVSCLNIRVGKKNCQRNIPYRYGSICGSFATVVMRLRSRRCGCPGTTGPAGMVDTVFSTGYSRLVVLVTFPNSPRRSA